MALSQAEFLKLTQKLQAQPMSAPTPGIGTNVKDQFLQGGKKALSGFETTQNAAKSGDALGVLRGALGMAAGGIQTGFSPIGGAFQSAAQTAPVKATIGAVDTNVVQPLANKISDSKTVQKFAMANPNAEQVTEDALAVAGSLYAPKGVKRVASAAENAASKLESIVPKPKGPTGPTNFTIDAFDDIKSRVSAPDVSDATKVSLNPTEALKNTANTDFKVSVGGKLKPISEVTDLDKVKIKASTERSLDKFKVNAERFKNDRNPMNDPTEIVGQRIDKALDFADKKRQVTGQKMGDVEIKYQDTQLPVSEGTVSKFAEALKDFDNPKFGADTANAPVVRKLIEDFDSLSASGASVGDRLQFVRAWEGYLNDAKDGFGNFKDNATANTRIQNAVKTLKNETLDEIAKVDKNYRSLRNQYRMYKELDETGNRLLGKDGLLGDRIKGGATVKRALKSNSDAGARQFLIKLKEITGYDALKDGDMALTAMDLVGDYQGLSLLEVLNDGKSGLIKRIGEKVQDKLVGDKEQRIRSYINKGDAPSKPTIPTVKPKSTLKNAVDKVTGKDLPNKQGGFIKTGTKKVTLNDELRSTITKELNALDTQPIKVDGKLEFGNVDANFRLEQLKELSNKRSLSATEAKEAIELLRKVGIKIIGR